MVRLLELAIHNFLTSHIMGRVKYMSVACRATTIHGYLRSILMKVLDRSCL